MANIRAALKQIRQDARRQAHNQTILSELKTLTKKFASLVSQDPKQAKSLAPTVVSKWDRAAAKGVVPRGRADRHKARIGRLLAARRPAP